MMPSRMKFLLIPAAAILLSACVSMTAAIYQPDFSSVNTLRDRGLTPVRVGVFASGSDVKNTLSLRAGQMHSSYGKSYAAYLQNALEQQLNIAQLLNAQSDIEITGVLEKNHFDASGVRTGVANISARFVMTRGETELYNRVHTINHTWRSSFAANTAVPDAQLNYALAMQKLLVALFDDQAFIAALKPESSTQ